MTSELKGLGVFLYEIIAPVGLLSKLGVILGGISVLSLIHYALQFGLAEAFLILISWYDRFLSLAIGWIPIERLLEWLFSYFSVDFDVNPHWKHIFVVSNIYFIRNAFSYNYREEDGAIRLNVPYVIFVLTISLIIGVIFSGLSGAYPASGNYSVFFIAWLPLLGFYLYDLIERFGTVLILPPKNAYSEFNLSKWMAFKKYIRLATERFLLATLLVMVCFIIEVVVQPSARYNYGVAIFLLATFLLAIYWISGRASLNYQRVSHREDIPLFVKLMKHSGTTYLGVMMLGTLIWGSIFVFLNAGLSLAGL